MDEECKDCKQRLKCLELNFKGDRDALRKEGFTIFGCKDLQVTLRMVKEENNER